MILKEKLAIIGSGPAGLTAALYASRAHISPLIIEGHEPGGQLMSTTFVENWPGELSITGPDLMKKLKNHAIKHDARFLSETVTKADLSKNPFFLLTEQGTTIEAQALIIATGAQPKRLGCPGESTYWGKGVSSCAVCDGAFFKNLPVIVVGGGDTAMENASFLTNFTDSITLIHRKSDFAASPSMRERVLNNKAIRVLYNSTVSAIEGDGTKVISVVVTDTVTGTSQNIPARGVFIAIGLIPSTSLFKNQLEMDSYGYLTLKEHTQTSVQGVFAAGDVADSRYRQAITSAGSGCAAFIDAERYLKSHNLL